MTGVGRDDGGAELDSGHLLAGHGDGRQRLDAEELGNPGPPYAGLGHLPDRLDHGGQAAAADHDSDVHRVTVAAAQPAGDSTKSNRHV